jgi:hypothetical protein
VPTVLQWAGYRFYFFSNEGFEPPHIHIDKTGNTAKFWLAPVILARNIGFSERDLRVIEQKVIEESDRFLEAWNEHFGPRR